MSIFDQGPRAVSEWAKEEIAEIIIKGIDELLENNPDWGLDEKYVLDKQKNRILKFLNIEIVKDRPQTIK